MFPNPFGDLWRLTAAMTFQLLDSMAQLHDARRLRRFWSAHLTQASDRYLRSPEFLALMTNNLRAMAAAFRMAGRLGGR